MEIKREYTCSFQLTKGEMYALQEACRETGLNTTQILSSLIEEHLFDFVEQHKIK